MENLPVIASANGTWTVRVDGRCQGFSVSGGRDKHDRYYPIKQGDGLPKTITCLEFIDDDSLLIFTGHGNVESNISTYVITDADIAVASTMLIPTVIRVNQCAVRPVGMGWELVFSGMPTHDPEQSVVWHMIYAQGRRPDLIQIHSDRRQVQMLRFGRAGNVRIRRVGLKKIISVKLPVRK